MIEHSIRAEFGLFSALYSLKDRLLFRQERKPVLSDPAGWRSRHPIRDTDPNLLVTYFVPIFERKRAPDWEIVQSNLARTVAALQRQRDPRWRMIVCSQNRPEKIGFDNRVRFLRYPASHGGASDKLHKLRFMARRIAGSERQDGYVFFLDGDDIPHPDLTGFVLEDNNGHGYYLPQGFCYDAREKRLFQPQETHEDEKNFAHLCGSSHAVRFDTRYDRSHILHISLRGNHMDARQNLLNRVGLHLDPVPFPAMIYIVNHGSSDQDLLTGGKRDKAMKALMEKQDIESILAGFGTDMTALSS